MGLLALIDLGAAIAQALPRIIAGPIEAWNKVKAALSEADPQLKAKFAEMRDDDIRRAVISENEALS